MMEIVEASYDAAHALQSASSTFASTYQKSYLESTGYTLMIRHCGPSILDHYIAEKLEPVGSVAKLADIMQKIAASLFIVATFAFYFFIIRTNLSNLDNKIILVPTMLFMIPLSVKLIYNS